MVRGLDRCGWCRTATAVAVRGGRLGPGPVLHLVAKQRLWPEAQRDVEDAGDGAIALDLAFLRAIDPRQRLEQGRFAGAVVADDREAVALAQFERNVIERTHARATLVVLHCAAQAPACGTGFGSGFVEPETQGNVGGAQVHLRANRPRGCA